MRQTRVHIAAPLTAGASLLLPPAAAQHVTRVLRLKAGAGLRVFDGAGTEHDATIETIQRDAVAVRVGARQAVASESGLRVTLLQGIARGEKMDLILQKCTELGVSRIVPVLAARSSVRLDERAAQRKQLHWQGVVISACEQSGRVRVPQVDMPSTLQAAVAGIDADLKLLLQPDQEARSLKPLLAAHGEQPAAPPAVCLLVGPEGGFDPQEALLARQAGFEPCRLGPRVLRTETAALAVLAALQFAAGDFG